MDTSHCHWEDCAETFSDAQALYDHLTTDHVTKRIGRGNSDGLRCKWTDSSHSPCSSSFGKRDHLTSHLRIHVPLKPHPCAVCKRAFKRPQDLKKHEKLHSEEDFMELQTSVKRSAAVGARMLKDAEPKHESDTSSSSESGDNSDDTARKHPEPIRPTLSKNSSNKRRVSDMDHPSDLKADRKFTNAGIECVKQFLVDVKRSKFCPSTVSSPQSDVDSNLSAHLDEISKYVSTFPSFLDMEPPLLPSPQPIPSSNFQQNNNNNMSNLSLDVLTNQDLTNVDDFLNSLATNLLDPFQKPSISPFMHGLRNEPMATASNSYLQSYDNSFFMFQNPSSGDMVPFNSHQVYQTAAPKFNNNNNNSINTIATQLNPSISSTPNNPDPFTETFYGFIKDTLDASLLIESCIAGTHAPVKDIPFGFNTLPLRSGSVVVFADELLRIHRVFCTIAEDALERRLGMELVTHSRRVSFVPRSRTIHITDNPSTN
ncbi:hypothetical protein HDU78_009687 [Chytriomyces hyalinus]|nr:hypothetical protein HDU78_009687 [Chytriomyces hyalinus]